MKFFLLTAGFTVLIFFIPALYAAVLVCLTGIFGESVFIHISVFAVFMLVYVCIMNFFLKDRMHREENTDVMENQDNDW